MADLYGSSGDDPALPDELRARIDRFLADHGLYDRLAPEDADQSASFNGNQQSNHAAARDGSRPGSAGGRADRGGGGDDSLGRQLRETGILDEVVRAIQEYSDGKPVVRLGHGGQPAVPAVTVPTVTGADDADGTGVPLYDPNRRYLRIHVRGGRAFLSGMEQEVLMEEMRREAEERGEAFHPGDVAREGAVFRDEHGMPFHRYYQLHLQMAGQRFSSSLIPATSTNPAVDEVFLVDLHEPSERAMPHPVALLRRPLRLRFVLTAVSISALDPAINSDHAAYPSTRLARATAAARVSGKPLTLTLGELTAMEEGPGGREPVQVTARDLLRSVLVGWEGDGLTRPTGVSRPSPSAIASDLSRAAGGATQDDRFMTPQPADTDLTATVRGESVSVEVVAVGSAPWQAALVSGRKDLALPLTASGSGMVHGAGADADVAGAALSGVPFGVLDMRMELVPPLQPADRGDDGDSGREAGAAAEGSQGGGDGSVDALASDLERPQGRCSQQEVAVVLRERSVMREAVARRFFSYAKQWWQDYCAAGVGFRRRQVRIFVPGLDQQHRAAVTTVVPTRAGRLMETPRHAARFVALLSTEQDDSIGPAQERWADVFSFLSAKSGTVHDHATLLCSLLLGFGLDCFVALGTRLNGVGEEEEHAWVISLSDLPDGHHQRDRAGPETVDPVEHNVTTTTGRASAGGAAMVLRRRAQRAVFWEATTGERLPDVEDGDCATASGHKFHRIHCLFRHDAFLGNLQRDDSVAACRWDLQDETLWKAMEAGLLVGLTRPQPCPLTPPTLDGLAVASEVEEVVRAGIVGMRRHGLGVPTVFDRGVEYALSPALCAYEGERIAGQPFGSEDLAGSIRRLVPRGHLFKALPLELNHLEGGKILRMIANDPQGAAIVCARGDEVRHAVRCRVQVYPEDAVAVWVMVAVSYRPLREG